MATNITFAASVSVFLSNNLFMQQAGGVWRLVSGPLFVVVLCFLGS